MKPIAIFYHCLFYRAGSPDPLPAAFEIVNQQMWALQRSGLLAEASHFQVGINGGEESHEYADLLLPHQARRVYHGLNSCCENPSIRMLEEWLPAHPGWHVFYFHAKGSTHKDHDPMRTRWRGCMMRHCVANWHRCVADLEAGYESVGCHWMTGKATPPGQSIWAGTFFWAQSDFLRTLPSILLRERIKQSGLGAYESRYEAEVWIGNGPRLPRVKDYHPHWDPGKIATCQP